MACKICLDTTMNLNRETGVMECPNGHQNYIGSPDSVTPNEYNFDKKTGRFERSSYMDNALFDDPQGPDDL